ncbi:putative extracellular solute-binding protein [[Actinomadura] parvosata subsp. kistnae]|uniref:Nitrate ABC transporter substrate-binding protein n=1 Tax=[Actinomadura] parvosata subsp. kistnae TaxID=1909395 RepID=A0A1V0A7E9_9ACTN|nr:ABC transporter substrate-binding protein [Nonomuraea sp. ATCC 55076]AQZ66072.1 nitrate ABC transporter substrate-binding protein [Nonomuraea sp. ATCC 55076]SPL97554.1 putative extracellular solute-binding protein [Actinomadura parvosata subsp. kistnae]
MTRKLRCHAIVLGVTVALTLAGCGGSGDSANTAANSGGLEKTNITVGALPIPDPVSLYIANAKGFFKEEGLTVTPKTITGGAAAIPAIENGSLDISQTNYVSTFLAVSQGKKIKLVADMYQAAPNTFNIMVPKDSPIKTVADLKGKTVLVNNLKNIAQLAVTSQLKVAGLAETDVKFVEKPFPEMGNTIQSGQADAGWITEPFITANQSKFGFRKLVDTMTGQTADLPIAGWMATEEWASKYPKTLAAFQRAISKAQQLASSDRKEIEAMLPKYTQIDAKTASVITLGAYPSELNANRLQKVADLMLEYGYLKNPIDVKSVIAAPAAG